LLITSYLALYNTERGSQQIINAIEKAVKEEAAQKVKREALKALKKVRSEK